MTPHIQTVFGNGDNGTVPGNCMQTALASFLDLPVALVPHLGLFFDWYLATKLWLDGLGKTLHVYTDDAEDSVYWKYIGVECSALSEAPTDRMLLASGASNNGPWQHIVLWKDGKLVHDTHPSHTGLKGDPTEYWQIEEAE